MQDSSFSADAIKGIRRMFIRDLVLDAAIGVYAHEHGRTQRIRINLDLAIEDQAARPGGRHLSRPGVGRDDLARVVDYEQIVIATRATVASGHVQLVETLAERLAELCLADARVIAARVTVEKLDVFPDAVSAGVEIERRRTP
ncbi:MAG: diguanylate cyclase [Acidiphilium sp. 37-64-53]|uniref:dihydroneopterin aldolase n=1 Tax=Acidiphilium TaxID=522 RepID=UPI000BDB1DFA|nr:MULTISPECIES: dihydroneopterin aldolase [Acidiphilium]OYW02321.1 MAG: diguanylate cyclase [Acidiphilium sp. 37-64-53]OZB29256.1 MAG: diguanylate cyclase [Acidiphilium sp. 34-64-41]HQT85474.1 dihydroneopterin aldolase [Acidiphilium rubrum]